MTYLENQRVKTFLDTLGNAARWGVWLAIIASLMSIGFYIGYIADNVHINFVVSIFAIWLSVYAGIEMKLEFP